MDINSGEVMEGHNGDSQEKARLAITLFHDNSIRVDGPIGDKLLAYGMLQYARAAIFEKHLMDKLAPKRNGGIIQRFTRGH